MSVSKLYTYDGETKTLGYFTRKYGVDYYLVKKRLSDGWSLKDALFTIEDAKDKTKKVEKKNNAKKELCIKCKYGSSARVTNVTCNYILMEHKMRGCPADNCNKYKPRKKTKSGLSEWQEQLHRRGF